MITIVWFCSPGISFKVTELQLERSRPTDRGSASVLDAHAPPPPPSQEPNKRIDLKWYKIMWLWWDWQFQCITSNLRVSNIKNFPGEHAPGPRWKLSLFANWMTYHFKINILVPNVEVCVLPAPWKIGLRVWEVTANKTTPQSILCINKTNLSSANKDRNDSVAWHSTALILNPDAKLASRGFVPRFHSLAVFLAPTLNSNLFKN